MQTNEEREITAYFPDRTTAQRTADDLERAGIDPADVELRDQHAGGFWEAVKRFFTGDAQEQYAEGCLLTVYGDSDVALPILQQYGARIGDAGYLDEEQDVTENQAVEVPVTREEVYVSRGAADDV